MILRIVVYTDEDIDVDIDDVMMIVGHALLDEEADRVDRVQP